MARPNNSNLTPAVIESLRAKINPETGKGFTDTEIAAMHGVTRAAVHIVKARHGGVTLNLREQCREVHFVKGGMGLPFTKAEPAARVRSHLKWVLSGFDDSALSKRELYLLRKFYERLRAENVVLEFDPAIQPAEKISTGGWAFRPREESDGDLIVRQNEHTHDLSDEKMAAVWRFPTTVPH